MSLLYFDKLGWPLCDDCAALKCIDVDPVGEIPEQEHPALMCVHCDNVIVKTARSRTILVRRVNDRVIVWRRGES